MNGKNINLFLLDGDVNGRIKCSTPNWTGVAYKIPRTELDKCKDRDDLKQSGVYFLFGKSDETGKDVVYVGQAGERKNKEAILNRLQEHKRNLDKEYWTEAIAFTSSNNFLGPTEISYLENHFYNLAKAVNRYEVTNKNTPTPGNITEEKESEMLEFIRYVKIIMGVLGHKVFEPVVTSTNLDNEIPMLYLERMIRDIGKVEAKGRQTAEGFVVLEGSRIASRDDDTIPSSVKEQRAAVLVDTDCVLKGDVLLSSPTYAAMFVCGKSTNGLEYWKTKDGKTLKQLELEEN